MTPVSVIRPRSVETAALSTNPPSRPQRIAVIGGGVTGLAAALRLEESEAPVDWTLFEAASRVGGVLQTVEQDGFRLELSADNFLTRDPWAVDLCRRVGVEDELLETDPARRRALVVNRGRVRRVPQGFVLMAPQAAWPILASPILSPAGKLRLAAEPFVAARRSDDDESVAAFARRRLGRETFERLIQPLVGGIYTADPERLSMAATMPQFVQQERQHGSLLKAAFAKGGGRQAQSDRAESGARYGLFVAPREGMQRITDAVAARLPADRLRLGVAVGGLDRSEYGWRVAKADGGSLGDFDAVIVTVPATKAADLVRSADDQLANCLGAIEYAGCSVACLGVDASQVIRPIDGFGFVVPIAEGRRLIAASFASYKFPGRAPDGKLLIRVFLGGALQPELADLEDAELLRIAREELRDLVGLQGEPQMARVARWPQRMPQYHVGHLERVAAIEDRAAKLDGIEIAGAALRGVGVPQCIRSGELAAERALAAIGVDQS